MLINRSNSADENKYHFITNGCPQENETILRIHSQKQGFIGIELESFAFSVEGKQMVIINLSNLISKYFLYNISRAHDLFDLCNSYMRRWCKSMLTQLFVC